MKITSCSGALLLATGSLAQKVILQPELGPYDVSLRTSELDDFSRPEIFAPDVGHRRLMVSVYSPIPRGVEQCTSPYMPKTVADYESAFYGSAPPPLNLTIDLSIFYTTMCDVDVTYGPAPKRNRSAQQVTKRCGGSANSTSFPLILFGTGHTAPRFIYSVMMQHFASHGYVTVLIDSPYSAHIVEFPNGDTALYSNETDATPEKTGRHIQVRTADYSFVLDQLSGNSTLRNLVLAPNVKIDSFEKVGVWGHSIGGATAVYALQKDDRFRGAINIDGALNDPAANGGVNRPVLTWQDDDNVTHPTWPEKWPLLKDYKQLLKLKGSLHNGMNDGAYIADLVKVKFPYFGSINGMLQIQTLVRYSVDFFKFVLQGEDLGLLSGPSDDYPHVIFLDGP